MLAKIWKKLLLVICIIACLFNITSKLVNRHSLEDNIKKANDGETVFDFSKTENNTIGENSNVLANNENTVNSETVQNANIVEESSTETAAEENIENTESDGTSLIDSVSSFFKFDNLF